MLAGKSFTSVRTLTYLCHLALSSDFIVKHLIVSVIARSRSFFVTIIVYFSVSS